MNLETQRPCYEMSKGQAGQGGQEIQVPLCQNSTQKNILFWNQHRRKDEQKTNNWSIKFHKLKLVLFRLRGENIINIRWFSIVCSFLSMKQF